MALLPHYVCWKYGQGTNYLLLFQVSGIMALRKKWGYCFGINLNICIKRNSSAIKSVKGYGN